MKKTLVLGASGNMGYALVQELAQQGISTIAFARDKQKLEGYFSTFIEGKQVEIQTGDAFNPADLSRAAVGVDTIFYALNIPYPEWEERYPTLMQNVLATAKQANSKVVIVDNIYAYGPNPGQPVTEKTSKNPQTKKGKLRLKLDEMAKQANDAGTPVLIAHFPDFYGPHAHNTMLGVTLNSVSQNKSGGFVGKRHIPREYIFTPDGAKALIKLAQIDNAYGQNWNIPGAGVITGEEIIQICRELTGYNKKVWTITKPMVALLGLFQPMMRELVEMMYLTEDPVVLDGSKLEHAIGEIPKTPYRDGIKQTLAAMRTL